MTYQIHLFNSSAERVAIIQDGIIKAASIDQSIDAAPTLTFTIPQNDPKSAFISPLYYAKVYNTQTSAYEFSIFELVDPDIVDSASELSIKATYQGILTRLSSEYVDTYDTTSSGKTFSTVITELLALQVNTPAITVGTIEPTATIAISASSSDIYSILNNIRDAYGGWFEVDASRALNWYNDNTNTPDREIRRKKNLKAITYTPGYSQIVNRVYAYGNGETDARINLTDAGEAHEYIEDATSQSLYGVKAKKYIDKSITHPATLLAYAQRILEEYKNPPYQYSVDIVNLADVNGYDYSLESLGLDTRVRIIDDLLSVDVNTSIVSMSINLLKPEEIQIELSTIKNDLSDLFGDILNVQDIASSVATQIGAGQVTVLGSFTVIDWASSGTTEIDGSNITTGSITLSTVNGGSGSIRSADYSAGSAGWIINSAGNAEFNNVTVRGNLDACTIGVGKTLTLNGVITCGDITIDGNNGTINLDDDILIKKRGSFGEIELTSSGTFGIYDNFTDFNPYIMIDMEGISIVTTIGGGYKSIYLQRSNGRIYTTELAAGGGNTKITVIDDLDLGTYNLICGNITTSGDINVGDDIYCDDIYLSKNSSYRLYESGGDLYWRGTKLN